MLSALATVDLGKQPWFWVTTVVIVGVLLAVNVLLILMVHARRVAEGSRDYRARRFRDRADQLLADHGPGTEGDIESARRQLSGLNALERPIAASMLIERLHVAPPEEQARTLEWLRQIGAIEVLFRSVRRRAPWRRALAIQLLGLAGADEAVPVLVERLEDRSHYVREAAVRALGQIGDARAVSALAQVFLEPGRVVAGVVYEALLAFGPLSAQVFREGLHSPNEHVRVPSAFGVGSVLDPADARSLLTPLLADQAAIVRAAAAETLGRIGGGQVTEELARASRDEERSVRRAAVSALSSYDDPQAVQLAASALDDPDRDTAMHAGETLVRLSRLSRAGPIAKAAAADRQAWPIERARILASLGVV